MISGIGAPPYSEDIAWPKAILNEIEVTCGKYRVMYDKAPSDSCDEFMADLTKLIRLRGAAVRYLMGKVDWDFLMVVFQSTDWVQHFFWRFFDKTHPLFVPDSSPCERNAIADTYQAIDDEVRKILDELRKDDYMFVVSDHGMGPLYKNIYLNNWLAKNGFLHYKWTPRYITHRMGITSGRLNKLLIKFRIASLRKPKFLGKREAFSYLTLSLSDIDWSRTRAYSIGLDGNVRLNVDGREPNGIVSFGNEYSRLIADLKTRIQNIRDPTTEERIADDVFSRDEIFVGPYLDQGPDLVPVLTRYHQDLNWGSNAIIGPSQADISGNHRPAGIMIVSGPSICKGRSLGPRSLINIAPTVLHLLGIHALEKLDGEMMTDIFDDSHKMEPEQTESADHSSLHINTPVVYTREEEEQLKQRLRKLGYL
jgi:predicted AlkP superfamily phosphohydrolase/phosphomutase